MFSSTIIPTIHRPTLARAIQSVLAQELDGDEFEVIVVNDSGQPLAPAGWLASGRVRVLDTQRRNRSAARNAGAAVARGRYLHFLDDDDWLLPHALQFFFELAHQARRAVWLYGGIQVVDQAGTVLGQSNLGQSGDCFAEIMGGAWVPIQASIIRTDAFFEAGGYSPLMTCTQDLDLCRKVSMIGDFASTPRSVACLLRGDGWNTSTDYLDAPSTTCLSRDEVLGRPGAYWRLMSSAARRDSAYWRGRVLRVALSTVKYNLQQRRTLTALSRAMLSAGVGLLSGASILNKAFWAGLQADHVPGSLHRILLDGARTQTPS
ncbi:MAG: glycosyltransferase family A protein [Candidatus Promineifilaceae bacterium]